MADKHNNIQADKHNNIQPDLIAASTDSDTDRDQPEHLRIPNQPMLF